jgi:hypothetical protein
MSGRNAKTLSLGSHASNLRVVCTSVCLCFIRNSTVGFWIQIERIATTATNELALFSPFANKVSILYNHPVFCKKPSAYSMSRYSKGALDLQYTSTFHAGTSSCTIQMWWKTGRANRLMKARQAGELGNGGSPRVVNTFGLCKSSRDGSLVFPARVSSPIF